MKEFSAVFHKKSTKEGEAYLNKHFERVTSDPIAGVKRGYCYALGAWSPAILEKNLPEIMKKLKTNCIIHKKKGDDDSETRKNAVRSLKLIFVRLGTQIISKEVFVDMIDQFCKVMDDYTVDRRGDIGSMVRETSMYSMLEVVQHLCNEELTPAESRVEYLSSHIMEKIVNLLLQQLVEKIDKMRLISGHILQVMFDTCYDKMPVFSEKEHLLTLFGNKYLRERVKTDLDRIDTKFDISLVDTDFLDYDKNEAFVYFWNVP